MPFLRHQKLEQEIKNRIKAGESREYIYQEVTRDYDKPQVVATLINSIPSKTPKRRYGWMNYVLAGMFLFFMVYNSFFIWVQTSGFKTEWLPFILVIILLSLWILIHTLRYDYRMYLLLGFLALMNIMHLLRNNALSGQQEVVNLLLLAGISFLAIFLRIKLFPCLGWLGPKKGEEGDFCFED